jgi:hypothetical protein
MSFLTDSQKAAVFAEFNTAMSTFLRPLIVYQEPQKTVIISDPNYNPLEGSYNQNDADVQNIPIYTTISGRITYDKDQEWSYLKPYPGNENGQLKVKDQTARSVRVKVDYSGYSLLSTCKKMELDGYLFDLVSQPRPHGPFGTGYWTFYFNRSL